MTKQRRTDLDMLRILACFLVIFNHLPGFALYMTASTALKTWVYMIPAMITKINVPIFFMISGTLLLTDRQETYSTILKKRFLRILYALMAATLALYLVTIIRRSQSFSLLQYIRYVLGESVDIGGRAYWYLYCYLGFLLLLPFFRRITQGITKADFILLMTIHVIFNSALPMINLLLESRGIEAISVSAHFTGTLRLALAKVMFYPLIGYYIDRKIDINRLKAKHFAALFLAVCVGILLASACTFWEGTHGDMTFTQNYVELFDYLPAIFVFLLIKKLAAAHDNFAAHPNFAHSVTLIGGLTFGIYLMDPILRRLFFSGFEKALDPHMLSILVSILWCFLSMIVCGLITDLLKKVPGIRRIL